MRKINIALASLGSVFLLAGCTNALYFYETEKISLTVEARPDSSQPVQGSLGIKQRVALLAPKVAPKVTKRRDSTGKLIDINGEALSSISSFSFKITPKPFTIFNPVLIQTAFITGEAAAELGEVTSDRAIIEEGKIAKAIGLSADDEVFDKASIDDLSADDRARLESLSRLEFDQIPPEDMNFIVSIVCGEKQCYSPELHKELANSLKNPSQ